MTFTTAWLDSIDPSTQSEEWQRKREAYLGHAAWNIIGASREDIAAGRRRLDELQSWLWENKR